MHQRAWRIFALGGPLAALICALFGTGAQDLLLLVASVTTLSCTIVGIRTWKPSQRGPWVGMAIMAGLLILASAVRAVTEGITTTGPVVADAILAMADVAAIASVYLLGRLRARDQDPTSLIDALILTLGVGAAVWMAVMTPYVSDHALKVSERVDGSIFFGFDLVLFFFVAKLAIGPGARSVSYYLLAGAAVGWMLSDLSINTIHGSTHMFGGAVLIRLLPALAYFAMSASSLHPAMARITDSGVVTIGRMTTSRLILMTLAIIAPSSLLVVRVSLYGPSIYSDVVLPACALITALVMARFAGIARAREHAGRRQEVLAESAASLVAAKDTNHMYKAATLSASRLIRSTDDLQIGLAHLEGTRWDLRARWSEGVFVVDTRVIRAESIEQAVLASEARTRVGRSILGSAHGEAYFFVSPLVSQNELRGALIVESTKPIATGEMEALTSLTTHLSLALETATLTETLHRQRSEHRFRALVESSSDLIVVLNDSEAITFLSPAAERLLGGRRGDVRALLASVHGDDRLAVLTMIDTARERSSRKANVECRFIDPEGEVRWFELSAKDMRQDPEVSGIILNAHDVTGRKVLEEDLRQKVLHDDLTGIANRALLGDNLHQLLEARPDSAHGPAVLFVDLDDFKTINDGLGHGSGDELLKVIAFRLTSFFRPEDTPARLGGDEFGILIKDFVHAQDIEGIAERLLDVIAEPIDFNGRDISITASIGVAFATDDCDAEVLLRNADVAMYRAKANGKASYQVFNDAMYDEAIERLDLKSDLASAVSREQLVLYYQPLINLQTGDFIGFEALLRWNHSVRGFVNPVQFIPLAEESGLIIPIGAWVLERSIEQLAIWNAMPGGENVKMSINVSPRQLENDDIVDLLRTTLKRTNVDVSRVILELTETGLITSEQTERLVHLRDLGVGLAADDFGTGFASYAALQQLPFTTVKIDRSLIIGIESPATGAAAQVRSIIEMAHATQLSVVAEGIEEEAQRRMLQEMGCDRGQGYLFARPLPAADARAFVGAKYQTEVLN